MRLVRRFFPVTRDVPRQHWFVQLDGKRHVTPLFLCLAAIVAADIAFAVDSIPAAFAITRDSVLIWMGNVFALLGLRALFVLVEGLIRRFRYLDETIAIVLGARRRQAADRGHRTRSARSPRSRSSRRPSRSASSASLVADRRDPDADAKREERGRRTSRSEGVGVRRRCRGGRGRGGAPAVSGASRGLAGSQLSSATASLVRRERVGGDATVADREGGDGPPVGDGEQHGSGERLGLVEGGEAGQRSCVDRPGGEEREGGGGGHGHSVGSGSVQVQRHLLHSICKFNCMIGAVGA